MDVNWLLFTETDDVGVIIDSGFVIEVEMFIGLVGFEVRVELFLLFSVFNEQDSEVEAGLDSLAYVPDEYVNVAKPDLAHNWMHYEQFEGQFLEREPEE